MADASTILERNRQFFGAAAQSGVQLAAVMIEDAPCNVCKTFILSYAFDDLPLLPSSACERTGGCGCSYIALPAPQTAPAP